MVSKRTPSWDLVGPNKSFIKGWKSQVAEHGVPGVVSRSSCKTPSSYCKDRQQVWLALKCRQIGPSKDLLDLTRGEGYNKTTCLDLINNRLMGIALIALPNQTKYIPANKRRFKGKHAQTDCPCQGPLSPTTGDYYSNLQVPPKKVFWVGWRFYTCSKLLPSEEVVGAVIGVDGLRGPSLANTTA